MRPALRKTYGEGELRVEALRGVDLRVEKGELLAIMGPSGSGKSTLLHLLGGVDAPTSGQVLLEEVDLATLSDDQRTIIRRRRIGFIFQSFNLLPTLTAEENVSLSLELDGVSTARGPPRALASLELVGMAAPQDALAQYAFGRRAAAGGDRTGPGHRAGHGVGRRADGQPR